MEFQFRQVFTFENYLFTFDKPFEQLVYQTPTPQPGHAPKETYRPVGDILYYNGSIIGLSVAERDLRAVKCSTDEPIMVPDPVTGTPIPTGWTYVPPGVNSQGESYGGGCRRDYKCKLHLPSEEEPFGSSGLPAEEDYECIAFKTPTPVTGP